MCFVGLYLPCLEAEYLRMGVTGFEGFILSPVVSCYFSGILELKDELKCVQKGCLLWKILDVLLTVWNFFSERVCLLTPLLYYFWGCCVLRWRLVSECFKNHKLKRNQLFYMVHFFLLKLWNMCTNKLNTLLPFWTKYEFSYKWKLKHIYSIFHMWAIDSRILWNLKAIITYLYYF